MEKKRIKFKISITKGTFASFILFFWRGFLTTYYLSLVKYYKFTMWWSHEGEFVPCCVFFTMTKLCEFQLKIPKSEFSTPRLVSAFGSWCRSHGSEAFLSCNVLSSIELIFSCSREILLDTHAILQMEIIKWEKNL